MKLEEPLSPEQLPPDTPPEIIERYIDTMNARWQKRNKPPNPTWRDILDMKKWQERNRVWIPPEYIWGVEIGHFIRLMLFTLIGFAVGSSI